MNFSGLIHFIGLFLMFVAFGMVTDNQVKDLVIDRYNRIGSRLITGAKKVNSFFVKPFVIPKNLLDFAEIQAELNNKQNTGFANGNELVTLSENILAKTADHFEKLMVDQLSRQELTEAQSKALPNRLKEYRAFIEASLKQWKGIKSGLNPGKESVKEAKKAERTAA